MHMYDLQKQHIICTLFLWRFPLSFHTFVKVKVFWPLSLSFCIIMCSSWKGSERTESTRKWNKALVQKERLKRNSRIMKLSLLINQKGHMSLRHVTSRLLWRRWNQKVTPSLTFEGMGHLLNFPGQLKKIRLLIGETSLAYCSGFLGRSFGSFSGFSDLPWHQILNAY